jgi:hypothetical protein
MVGSLEGPLAKLAHAERQARVLKAQIETLWPPGKTWPVRAEVDRDGLEYRFYLVELPPIDPEWALMTGDVLFNARSSIDHLVYQLHIRELGIVPADVEKDIMFPISDKPARFPSWRIKHLAEAERRVIVDLQTYSAGDEERTRVQGNLSLLNDLHRIDKHRKLHFITSSQDAFVIQNFGPETGFEHHPQWGPVNPEGYVDRWTFTQPPSNVKDYGGAILHVALEYRSKPLELLVMLHQALNGAGETLRLFRDRFPPVSLSQDVADGHHWWTHGW